MIKDIKGIIFDMDGTLLDSLVAWDFLWTRCGEKFLGDPNFRPLEKDDKIVRTSTFRDAMNHIHSVYNIANNGEELLETLMEATAEFYANEVVLKDGVLEFLEYCYKKGIKMCVATATAMNLVNIAIDHCNIRKYFVDILSCDEVGKGKDKPDIYLMALEKLGTKLEETWVFEDSHVAVNTAHNIGLKTVGIYDKYNFGHDEIKRISDIYIDDGETMRKLMEE